MTKITTRTNRGQTWTAKNVLLFGKEISTAIMNRGETSITRMIELIALKKGMSISGIGHFLTIYRYASRSSKHREIMLAQKNLTAMLAVVYPSQNRSQKITMTRNQFEAAIREAVAHALRNVNIRIPAKIAG